MTSGKGKANSQKKSRVSRSPKQRPQMTVNVGLIDRLLRVFVSEILLILAYFWLPLWPAVAVATVAFLLLITAIVGYCSFYTLIGIDTVGRTTGQRARLTPWWQLVPLLAVVALLPLISGLASVRHTGQRFLQDFNDLHDGYKQLSLNVAAGRQLSAWANLGEWQKDVDRFIERYTNYRPFIVKRDLEFTVDLAHIKQVERSLVPLIRQNDLAEAQQKLDSLQPVWSDMLSRNRISGAQVSVVAAADVLLKIARAGQMLDAPYVLASYPLADLHLREIESYRTNKATAAVRTALENLKTVAQVGQTEQLPQAGKALEDSFNRLYLEAAD